MKITKLAFAATFIFGSQAFADMIKPADLIITCVEQRAPATPRTFKIISSRTGSSVTFNGRTVNDEQLTAGSEGGAPYLQAVSNQDGYNITISGGSLEKAFNQSTTIAKGQAVASVSLFSPNASQPTEFSAICSGSFSFED